jgi:putative spermidine/putrescine transport system permease protein
MASVIGAPAPSTGGGGGNVLKVGKVFRSVVLGIVGLFFLVPIVSSARFSFTGTTRGISFSAYSKLLSDPQFWSTLFLSAKIGLGTVLLTLLLLIPTTVWVHWKAPKIRRVMEALSLLPLVIPSVVITLGVITSFGSLPNIIMGTPVILALEYVILALPYTYRTLDSAVQALDIKTLVEAGQSLGASLRKILWWVLLPNLRSGVLGVVVLAFAFCLGEFAVASLLSFTTFAVYLVQIGQTQASEAIAFSLIALLFTWIPLSVVTVVFSRRSGRRKKGGALLAAAQLTSEVVDLAE